MQEIMLDLTVRDPALPRLHAKQGDVGRKFRAVITDGGAAYEIPADAVLSAWYSGASGEGNYSMIGENSAFAIEGNTVTVELITQMLNNHGGGNLSLVMNRQDGTQIGTWNIPYDVEKLPGMGSPAAEQYFTALSENAAKAAESAARAEEAAATIETDESLSVAGKAADAAATGEALAGKAPAGYGLGVSEAVIITDCNLAIKSGWYRTTDETLNIPLARGNWLRVDAYSDKWTHQVWFNDTDGGGEVHRYQQNGVWTEWEWENPPMAVGVEYRTTERRTGKTVYTKLVEIGQLPNSSTKTVSTGVDASRIFRSDMSAYNHSANANSPIPYHNFDGQIAIYIFIGTDVLVTTNHSAFNGYSASVQVWYV